MAVSTREPPTSSYRPRVWASEVPSLELLVEKLEQPASKPRTASGSRSDLIMVSTLAENGARGNWLLSGWAARKDG
ncbi:MAG: hypothetical protein HC901_03685 [Bdellovibrionaceae bacterium]|nr:hypothetical protein [Pseudobdellovibrionaceae bacterium]